AQAGLSAAAGSALATANYVGYLAGALLAIFVPALVRSALAYRASLVVVIAAVGLPATRWRASATSSRERSWSPRSTRARRPGWGPAPGCWPGWRRSRRPRCGPGWAGGGHGR